MGNSFDETHLNVDYLRDWFIQISQLCHNYFFCRFYSTNDPDELTSLDAYISRMKDDQDTILYIPGDSKEAILKNPVLKRYQREGYEVLLLSDPIDEFTTQHLTEYEKRKVKSITKDDVNILDASEKSQKKRQ